MFPESEATEEKFKDIAAAIKSDRKLKNVATNIKNAIKGSGRLTRSTTMPIPNHSSLPAIGENELAHDESESREALGLPPGSFLWVSNRARKMFIFHIDGCEDWEESDVLHYFDESSADWDLQRFGTSWSTCEWGIGQHLLFEGGAAALQPAQSPVGGPRKKHARRSSHSSQRKLHKAKSLG